MATQSSFPGVPTPTIPEDDEKRLRAIAASVSRNHPDKWGAFEFARSAYLMGGRACHMASATTDESAVLSIEELEKRAIARALVRANGSRRKAAKLLGIGKTTLYRKLRDLKVMQDDSHHCWCPVCGTRLDLPDVASAGDLAGS